MKGFPRPKFVSFVCGVQCKGEVPCRAFMPKKNVSVNLSSSLSQCQKLSFMNCFSCPPPLVVKITKINFVPEEIITADK